MKPTKPLGRKAYGSIPHLPGSRMGPAEHHCHVGQMVIATEKARDQRDRIIVTEKLDGSNVCIACTDNGPIALGRAGYPAITSPYEQHILFDRWVKEHRDSFSLKTGYTIHGEWLALAHGSIYRLEHEPFVVFDIMEDGKRIPWDRVLQLSSGMNLPIAGVLSDGPPVSTSAISSNQKSLHGCLDPVEGAVWRVERDGEFDFMAKWVRPDKIDGKYLPIVSRKPFEIWNWRPASLA